MTSTASPSPAPQADVRVGTPAIELKGLSKSFPGGRAPALDGVDLSVPRGGIFGILGPNGAGKTTLMSILGGLILPSSGSVRIDGHDVLTEARHIRHILGLVPQEPAIYPTLTARENLDFFGRMQGLSGAYLESRIQACLELAEMTGEADQRVEQFSGGYKRRLNMVIGLMHEPEILILDEPTVAIDPHSRALIHDRLRELNAAGISILISTHYMEEAELLCDEIAIIDHGRLMVQGLVPDLLAQRRDEAIELQFFGEPGAGLARALETIPGVQRAEQAGCRVRVFSDRPEQVIAPIMQRVQAEAPTLRSLVFGRASLEQVFLSLTGDRGAPR
ncbi:MAG: ABC transporter ATP-binding protein [Betaproteobacteria bacterium]|nr:ABC transporter ATP-binding protein [Betaproteobacteria bacterium]